MTSSAFARGGQLVMVVGCGWHREGQLTVEIFPNYINVKLKAKRMWWGGRFKDWKRVSDEVFFRMVSTLQHSSFELSSGAATLSPSLGFCYNAVSQTMWEGCSKENIVNKKKTQIHWQVFSLLTWWPKGCYKLGCGVLKREKNLGGSLGAEGKPEKRHRMSCSEIIFPSQNKEVSS